MKFSLKKYKCKSQASNPSVIDQYQTQSEKGDTAKKTGLSRRFQRFCGWLQFSGCERVSDFIQSICLHAMVKEIEGFSIFPLPRMEQFEFPANIANTIMHLR